MHSRSKKHGHLGGCSLDAKIEEIEPINPTAESTGYEDPFDTYTAFNPALVQVLHKPNFHWSKTVHANSLNSMSIVEAKAELAGLKMHAESKSDEAAASNYFSRGPYLRQFIEELGTLPMEDPSVATLDVTPSTMGMDSSSTTVRIVVLCRECVSTLPSSYLI